jgi:hypothetical protein
MQTILSKKYHESGHINWLNLYYNINQIDMIDSFKVKADIPDNKLHIQLRGFFMKSEIELAFYLARKEIKKLKEGFEVILDFDGMHADKSINSTVHSRAKRIFNTLGAGKVKTIGAMSKLPTYKRLDLEYFAFESVGFYPN